MSFRNVYTYITSVTHVLNDTCRAIIQLEYYKIVIYDTSIAINDFENLSHFSTSFSILKSQKSDEISASSPKLHQTSRGVVVKFSFAGGKSAIRRFGLNCYCSLLGVNLREMCPLFVPLFRITNSHTKSCLRTFTALA